MECGVIVGGGGEEKARACGSETHPTTATATATGGRKSTGRLRQDADEAAEEVTMREEGDDAVEDEDKEDADAEAEAEEAAWRRTLSRLCAAATMGSKEAAVAVGVAVAAVVAVAVAWLPRATGVGIIMGAAGGPPPSTERDATLSESDSESAE